MTDKPNPSRPPAPGTLKHLEPGEEPPRLDTLPADIIGLLEDFLPHIQEVANAAIAWQVQKLLSVRQELIDGGISDRQAGGFALELIKSATKIPAQNAIPFGVPQKTQPDSADETPLARAIRASDEAGR